jgi:flagellar basal body-associated protein FliL
MREATFVLIMFVIVLFWFASMMAIALTGVSL